MPHSAQPEPPPPTGDKLLALGRAHDLQPQFHRLAQANLTPGLISKSYGSLGTAWTADGPVDFTAAGRLRLQDKNPSAGLPAIGDWVALRTPTEPGSAWLVHEILPRRTTFYRKMAGTAHRAQLVAANMDIIFVVTSLNRDFNPRRLERYLTLARESGARPVIVLSKADIAGDELPGYIEEAASLDSTTPVHAVSALTGHGMDDLTPYLQPGIVTALLGSSGVGKSTLINHWLGTQYLRVNEIRNDERGRHTTTHRELIQLPGGALVIDTPGMREIQLLEHTTGIQDAFDDIAELATHCKFTDCAHREEPGCAVKNAIQNGTLDEDRLEHYHQLTSEIKLAEEKRLQMERRRTRTPRRHPRG